MTYKGAIDEVKSLSQNPMMPDIFKPSLNKIAETLEMETDTEPCEDIINRKEAIFALNDAQVEYDENYKGLGKAKEIIDNLSSVQPKTDFERKAEIVISQLRADRDRLQDAIDKIKVEIKEWYWQADKQALAKDPCVVDAMIDLFIRTIDKYTAEIEG